MPSPRTLSVIALVLLGSSFAGGNLWFTAARSTIPLRLRGDVIQQERRIEKTRGIDDVCLVTLTDVGRIQVDAPVYEAVFLSDMVEKQAWSRTLRCGDRVIDLAWSPDAQGMIWAMPLMISLFATIGFLALRKRPRTSEN